MGGVRRGIEPGFKGRFFGGELGCFQFAFFIMGSAFYGSL